MGHAQRTKSRPYHRDCARRQHRYTDGYFHRDCARWQHRHTDGALCAKVSKYTERTYHPERVLTPLKRSGVFPPMVTRMISIGERSGALESLLEKISTFYDEQVEQSVKSLTSLIEPIMIGVMGLMVGGIVLAVFYPILKLQSALM